MVPAERVMGWYVYIIEASDSSLYTGVTTDVERRFNEHCSTDKGARFFRGRKPIKVVYTENQPDRGSALRRESEIKKLKRVCKLELIGANPSK
jgi:putative endonuclease